MNIKRDFRDENGELLSTITPRFEKGFIKAYHMTFNRVKNQYRTYGKDFVKAQINNDKYGQAYKTDSFYSNIRQIIPDDVAYCALYYAVDDAIQQIFGEHREPEQLQYNDIQFID